MRRPTERVASLVPGALILAAIAGLLAFGAGPASAGPLTCGQTITQNTKLNSDLIDCPENGVVIGADDIILDLAGHTIDGTGVGSAGSGVANTGGYEEVTIKNGTVQEFFNGVLLISASEDRLEKLTLSNNNITGIALVESENSRIERNTASGNFVGIALFASKNNLVKKNSVSGNVAGMAIAGGENNLVEKNSASGNGVGMQLSSTRENRVERNSVSSSSEDGINLLESHENLVQGNSVSNSARIGIHLNSSGANRIKGNFVPGNGSQAILLVFSHQNVVTGNSVSDSLQGINISDSLNTVVRGNSASADLLDGIFVNVFSDGTLVADNVANGNSDDGIQVDNVLTTLTGNRANNNGDLGIEAVEGVIDGGGNKAKGNGNPAQCTGVACS